MLVLVRIIPPVEYGRFGAVLGLLMLLNSFGFGGFVAQAMQLPDGREPDWSLHWSAGLGVTMTLRGFFPATVAGVLSRVPGGERVSGRPAARGASDLDRSLTMAGVIGSKAMEVSLPRSLPRRPRYVTTNVLVPASLMALTVASSVAWLLTADWIAAVALWVLWAGWHYLRTPEGPAVLALAFAFQWTQVTAGVFYDALTGNRLPAMDLSDYRPMVLIGLGCLVTLLLGLRVGMRLIASRDASLWREIKPAFGWRALILLYLISVVATGTLQELAWEVPALTQGILALSYMRFALLFLIFRRLSQPTVQWGLIALFGAFEIALGFTGYFAGFREPLMMAAVALTGAFDRRKVTHWVVLGVLGAVMLLTGVLWMGIRGEYRQDFESDVFAASREVRLARVAHLTAAWTERSPAEMLSDVESLIDRLWAVYYPALAVQRVPSVVPHEDGAILWGAVWHLLTPRLFFPDKPEVESDSEMVRKYAGVPVAGPETGTSIAFGYAAESYVDFGVPLMFVPVFLYGCLMGMAYVGLPRLIRDRELAVAAVTVILWLSLYLFERSWIRTLGSAGTLLIYLGGATLLIDRVLSWWRRVRADWAPARPRVRTKRAVRPR